MKDNILLILIGFSVSAFVIPLLLAWLVHFFMNRTFMIKQCPEIIRETLIKVADICFWINVALLIIISAFIYFK